MWRSILVSKLHHLVSLSPAEADYISISAYEKIVTWLRRLFAELLTSETIDEEPQLKPTDIYTENTSVILLSTNDQVSERNKHIELKLHQIRDLHWREIIAKSHVISSEQLTDMLSKLLVAPQLNYLLNCFMIFKTEQN